MSEKRSHIIANGAGKTMFARRFLTHEAYGLNVINADLITAGLSPFQLGKVAIQVCSAVANDESVAFETTLSGRIHAQQIPEWQRRGHHVGLVFLKLEWVQIAIDRVVERVRQGGWHIPDPAIQ